MASLQACIDDSNSEVGDQRLYMAGFLMLAEHWTLFSADWDKEIKAEPSIRYFKMAEANGMRGQFGGWTSKERDLKLQQLWSVIQHYEPVSFEVSESRQAYLEVFEHAPYFLNTYFFLASGVAIALASTMRNINMMMPLEFVFDQQSGLSADLDILWETITEKLPIRVRRLLASPPTFRDDRDFLPLQAADFLVWQLRRAHETGLETSFSKAVKESGRHLDLNSQRAGDLGVFRDGLKSIPSARERYGSKADWRKAKAKRVPNPSRKK